MLNRSLGFQMEIVPNYGGSIDKFVGDEMMALFIGEDALKRAIDCAGQILVPQALLVELEVEVPVKELHKIAFKGFSKEMEVAELSWQT